MPCVLDLACIFCLASMVFKKNPEVLHNISSYCILFKNKIWQKIWPASPLDRACTLITTIAKSNLHQLNHCQACEGF